MRPLAEVMGAALPTFDGPVHRGAHVHIGANLGPVFEIVHIEGETAWVRPLANGSEGLVPVARLRKVG